MKMNLFLVLGRIWVKEILNMSLSLAVLKPIDGWKGKYTHVDPSYQHWEISLFSWYQGLGYHMEGVAFWLPVWYFLVEADSRKESLKHILIPRAFFSSKVAN